MGMLCDNRGKPAHGPKPPEVIVQRFSTFIMVGTIAILLSGCEKPGDAVAQDGEKAGDSEASDGGISITVNRKPPEPPSATGKLPIFSKDDWEINNRHDKPIRFKRLITQKPPFYTGQLPFSVGGTQTPEGTPEVRIRGGPMMLKYEFEGFSSVFVYELGGPIILRGAIALGADGKRLAEARFFYTLENRRQAIIMEEYHYGPDGTPAFNCRSHVNPESGAKESETVIKGKKGRDYFFLMPIGRSALFGPEQGDTAE